MIPAAIQAALKEPINNRQPVHGGDINKAFRITTSSGIFFLKYNDARQYPGMLEQEAAGLHLLRQSDTVSIPAVIQSGVAANYQYLLLEWLQCVPHTPIFWERLGRQLAELHRCTAPAYGGVAPNYIGSLPQNNPSCTDWGKFYAHFRIAPLVQQLVQNGVLDKSAAAAAERLCSRINTYFPPEPPALLHGDLWSGNILCVNAAQPVLIDPAVYYGHREMDLGMTLLFGGFDPRFYAAYEEAYPLESGWKKRLWLTQLYPLLVHAVLFGGHYVEKLRSLLLENDG